MWYNTIYLFIFTLNSLKLFLGQISISIFRQVISIVKEWFLFLYIGHRVKSKIALWLVFKHGLEKHERYDERDTGGWNLLFLLLFDSGQLVYFILFKLIGTFDFQTVVSVHKTAMFEIKDWSSKLAKKSCCFAKPSYISDKILLQQLNADWDWTKTKTQFQHDWLAIHTALSKESLGRYVLV